MRTRHLLLLAHMAPSGVPTVHHLPSGARMGPSSSSATVMPHEQPRARFLSDPRRNSRETSWRAGAESWGWRMPSVTRRCQTALRSGRPSRPGCPRATPGHLSLASPFGSACPGRDVAPRHLVAPRAEASEQLFFGRQFPFLSIVSLQSPRTCVCM